MAIAPFAGRSVRAADYQSDRDHGDANEWNNEIDPPSNMRPQSVADKAIEDSRHQKICDTSSGVTEASCQGVRSTDNVLVEEAGRPDLTWDEAASQYTNEETEDHQACSTVHGPCQSCWDGAQQETASESPSRAESITRRSSNEPDEEPMGSFSNKGVPREMDRSYVATRAMIFELEISCWVRCRSFLMVTGNYKDL